MDVHAARQLLPRDQPEAVGHLAVAPLVGDVRTLEPRARARRDQAGAAGVCCGSQVTAQRGEVTPQVVRVGRRRRAELDLGLLELVLELRVVGAGRRAARRCARRPRRAPCRPAGAAGTPPPHRTSARPSRSPGPDRLVRAVDPSSQAHRGADPGRPRRMSDLDSEKAGPQVVPDTMGGSDDARPTQRSPSAPTPTRTPRTTATTPSAGTTTSAPVTSPPTGEPAGAAPRRRRLRPRQPVPRRARRCGQVLPWVRSVRGGDPDGVRTRPADGRSHAGR